MDPFTLAALAVGSIVLTRRRRRSSASRGRTPTTAGTATHYGTWAEVGPPDRAAVLNEIRGMSIWLTNRYGIMPFLADYLTVIGYIESRYNPLAANPEISRNPRNAARGLFGMRPETAFNYKNRLTPLVDYPDTLYSIRWAFVTAVDNIARAAGRVIAENSGVPNWVAMRRWWAIPSLVHDFDESKEKSRAVRGRLEDGINACNDAYGTNIDPDFIWMPVEAQGYPGIGALMNDFGLDPQNPYAAAA